MLETATGIGVTVAGALLTGSVPSAEQAASTTPTAGLDPSSLPKRWSQQEMHRRWATARAAMKEQKFDGLLVTDRPDGSADIGWLTGSGGQYAVLAPDGNLLVISGDGGERYDGLQSREAPDGKFSEAINAAIKELGLTRGRIGVGYLQDVVRLPEGGFNYTTLDRVKRANPRARFDSAAHLLLTVKLPRSAEEVGVLEKATAISELGLQAIQRTARPGAIHRDVWLAVYHAMVNAPGEFPTRLSPRSGQEGNTAPRPLEEVMQGGTVCNQELSATVLGYGSQVNQSMLIGGPAPADWRDAALYCIDVFEEMLAWIKPGKPSAPAWTTTRPTSRSVAKGAGACCSTPVVATTARAGVPAARRLPTRFCRRDWSSPSSRGSGSRASRLPPRNSATPWSSPPMARAVSAPARWRSSRWAENDWTNRGPRRLSPYRVNSR